MKNALALIQLSICFHPRVFRDSPPSAPDDPRRGRTTAEIEEIRRGDPDPSLFSPPEGYIIKDQNPQPPTIVAAPTPQ